MVTMNQGHSFHRGSAPRSAGFGLLAVLALVALPARAAEGPEAPDPAAAAAPAAGDEGGRASSEAAAASGDDSSGLLVAGKIGGMASFNSLSPFPIGGIEIGWVFAGTSRRIAAVLDVSYTAPSKAGTATEDFDPERVPGGKYSWELRQKQLVLQPTFLYRLTGVAGSVTPYAGIGPRVYLLEGVTRGKAGGVKIDDSFERSTKFGVGIPLGAELALGPGGLFAELLFQWAPLDHRTTGDSNLGSGSLFLGYRAVL